MSGFNGWNEPVLQGFGGALKDRRIEAHSAEEAPRSGPRRAPGTLERRVKVYGATPSVPGVVAEAPQVGAGSHVRRSDDPRNGRPHGSAAGGSECCSANRRCSTRIGARGWSC